jgi:hypothetical protein
MTNSISCPVCQNLCSSLATSCPKCGHPLNNKSEAETSSVHNPQPFLIILRVIAVISLIIGVLFGLSLIYGLFFNFEGLMARGGKNVLLFLGGIISYAFFSFLISQSKKK